MSLPVLSLRLLPAILALASMAGLASAQIADCNANGVDDSLDIINLATATAANSCAAAPEVGTGYVYTGTTAGSTNDVSVGSCGSGSSSPDVWFRYTPASAGTLRAELCGSAYDTVLSIFSTCPTQGAAPIVCNDDSCSLQSRVQTDVQPGQSYLIRVTGFNNATGAFSLLLAGPPSLFGGSLDTNGNSIPDECETTIYSVPHRLDVEVAEGDSLSSRSLVIGLRDDSSTTITISENSPWLNVQPTVLSLDSGSTTTLEVNFTPEAAPLGVHTALITLQDTEVTTNTLMVPVRLRRFQHPPAIALLPTYSQVSIRQGQNLSPRHIELRNPGRSPLPFEVATSPGGQNSWLSATPSSGTLPQDQATTLTVNFATQSLAPGRYFGYVFVLDQQGRIPGSSSTFELTVLQPDCNGNNIDDPIDIANGTSQDCNRNGIPDECDIARGTAADTNQNGIPDTCEPGACSPPPFYDGFEANEIATHWHQRTDADGRIRIIQEGNNRLVSMDDAMGPERLIFTTDFESTDSLNLFAIRSSSANGTPDFRAFLYDYSSYTGPIPGSGRTRPAAIPRAPFSAQDSPTTPTMALRLEVNQLDSVASAAGVTVYPATREAEAMSSFGLRFDAFMNYAGVGSPSGGTASGVGTTEHLGAGLAASSASAIWPIAASSPAFSPLSAWWWAMTGDGGVSADYTYYEASAADTTQPGVPLADAAAPNWWSNGGANTNNNSAAWRAFFPYPAYEGSGAPGKEWVTVDLTFDNGVASLYMTPAQGTFAGSRALVAQWTPGSTGTGLQGVPTTGTPFISYFDMFNSITSGPADQFALIDNVRLVENPGNDIPSLNQLTFCANLAGLQDVVLEFKARVSTPQTQPAASPLRDNAPFNGVLASTDFGRTWHVVHAFTQPTTETLTQAVVDLDDVFTSSSLSYTSATWIRFSQFGNDEGGGLQLDDVRLYSLTQNPPAATANPSSLSTFTVEGNNPAPTTLRIRNSGGGVLNYTLSSSSPWIVVPSGGSSIGEEDTLTIQFNAAALGEGLHTGSITVSAEGAEPLEVPVTLRVFAKESRAFSFDQEGEEGWTFTNPVMTGFRPVTGTYEETSGRLDITTSGTISFGFWESPIVKVSRQSATPGIIDPNPLYALEMTITGEATTAQAAPTVRLRASSLNFAQTDVLTVTSFGGAASNRLAYAPSVNPRIYRHYFTNPLGTQGLRLDFDVLVADTEDALPARTSLHSVVLTAAPQPSGAGTTVVAYDFRNSQANGFTARDAAPLLARPERMIATQQGLLISNLDSGTGGSVKDDTNPVIRFGYWGFEAPAVTLQGGKLYRMDATVLSEAPAGSELDVAVFRMRLNTSSLVFSALTNIDSKADSLSLIPNTQTARTYSTWFRLPQEMHGDTAIFSFDYLEDGQPTAGAYGVFLQTLTLRRMD